MASRHEHRNAFDAFNARFLTVEEIASTFIPPTQYADLIKVGHSVIYGPRGSGKTTLLRMLQLKALAAWEHPEASKARQEIEYHSIFLGTDVLWGSQLESRTSGIGDREKEVQIRRTSFRIHLALAVLDAIEEGRHPSICDHPELKRLGYKLSPEKERLLAQSLAAVWELEPIVESMLGLRVALQTQLKELLLITNKLRRDDTYEIPSFADLDPVASVTSAIDLINTILEQPSRRWAILCDELEIAPDMVRKELLGLLRSTYSNVIFKFSLFPHTDEVATINDAEGATENNDYKIVKLYYSHREEAFDFCSKLLKGMVERHHCRSDGSPERVLGDSFFDGGRAHRRDSESPFRGPDGTYYKITQERLKNDPAFAHWFKEKGYDLERIADLPEPQQAQYRKIVQYLRTRHEFLRDDSLALRSRKSRLLVYVGAYSLFSLTEGNPRIFINLMRPLVERHAETNGGVVAKDLQARCADQTIKRFRASLSAIPTKGVEEIRSVLQIIEIVGRFFERTQLGRHFSPEPHSSFTVDPKVPEAVLILIGRALNAGAFVRMPVKESRPAIKELTDIVDPLQDLVGARLRLAYTLAPDYSLPLVANRSINLSTILKNYRHKGRMHGDVSSQVTLPFGDE